MEKQKEVVFKKKATNSIRDIAFYILTNGYPENAEKFVERLLKFSNSLSKFPEKYPICNNKHFAKRKYHCAVFASNYIFVYNFIKNKLVVFNIIHCSRLK
jgi:plasmid stabilization system protein ParE